MHIVFVDTDPALKNIAKRLATDPKFTKNNITVFDEPTKAQEFLKSIKNGEVFLVTEEIIDGKIGGIDLIRQLNHEGHIAKGVFFADSSMSNGGFQLFTELAELGFDWLPKPASMAALEGKIAEITAPRIIPMR